MNRKKPLNIYTKDGWHVIKDADGDMTASKHIPCQCGDTNHLMCVELTGYHWDNGGDNKGVSFDLTICAAATLDPYLSRFWTRLKECFTYLFKQRNTGLYYNCTMVDGIDTIIYTMESAKRFIADHQKEFQEKVASK